MLKRVFADIARERLGLGGGASNILYRLMRDRGTTTAPAPVEIVKSATGQTHLVIGDAHAAPGQNLERFTFLSKMIRDLRPDVVICIGDFADMPALSSFDKGKKAYEGRRYTEDIKAANEALRLLHKDIDEHNRTFPSDPVKPRLVYCEGNHEYRIERALNDSAGLDVMGLKHLDFARRGWEVYRFKKPVEIDGVNYCHFFTSQNTDRAISGVSAARSLVNKKHDVYKEYAGQSNTGWWAGICVLRDVTDGDYDLELWSYKRIKARWS